MRSPEATVSTSATGEAPERARRFFDEALVAFDAAVVARGLVAERIAVAGRTAEMRFAGPALHARLFPALAHLRVAGGDASIVVHAFDSRSTEVRMPPPPWGRDDVVERGEIRDLRHGPLRIAFNVGSGMLVAHDRDTGRALVWTRDADAVPFYETASPVRPLLAWWLGDAGLQVVHAAAVGTGGRGVLLTGRGGSGKTTTALLCVEAGWAYAGDNNLVLESGNRLRGHALYASATVRPGTLERMPRLRERLRNANRLEEEKGLLFVDDRGGGRMLPSFDVDAVLLPRVAGGTATRTAPATAGECLAALAPSSLLPLPLAGHETFARLVAIARSAPAHHLHLADDVADIPGVVGRFLGTTP
ncbi:MAG TPA: hypothetical protein VND21_05580 [Planctomycetota bacterium]|nr:hypothetical protein [Planctomycetota bacterium]